MQMRLLDELGINQIFHFWKCIGTVRFKISETVLDLQLKESVKSKKGYDHDEFLGHAFFSGAPGGARFLRVKIPNSPSSGNDITEGNGIH